jgi:hypothetical protein
VTTLILANALFLGGSLLAARRGAVRVAGICAALAGLLLWFGLGTLCGWSGPLSQCAVMQ